MEFVGRVFKSLITSVLVSLILFVISFSVITNEFPPRLSRMKAGIENTKKLLQMTQDALNAQSNQNPGKKPPRESNTNGAIDLSNDDQLVENTQKLNKKRRTLGEQIFDFGESIESAPAVSSSAPSQDLKSDILALRTEVAEIKFLIKQVRIQQAELKDAIHRR